MTTSANGEPPAGSSPGERPLYLEPGRTYTTTVLLAGVLVVGLIIDISLGGAASHAIAWAVAFVIVVGADTLAVRSARRTRSVVVTGSQVLVGVHALARAEIIGVESDFADSARILGRGGGEGMPRGVAGLALHLGDGSIVVVPTRKPAKLVEALGIGEEAVEIRLAMPGEYEHLIEVERRADQLFTLSGLGAVPGASSTADLEAAAVVFAAGRPAVGFARVLIVDGAAHLEQLSVLPRSMRRGVGTALVEAVCGWAGRNGCPAVTLLTYTGVPWTASFYSRLGFAPMPELTPGLAERQDWEHAIGMDSLGPRAALRLDL
ncbi:MAG TPA: GNAT family N-acetyltransferase [Jatrophihabitantaceae bacterium]|nr:GNAT family N-acetyltransferase [Jatrophihabitantaceae bacterium]